MPSSAQPSVFVSHSHRDQSVSYAVTEWISRSFPDIGILISHDGLGSREQIETYSYLKSIADTTVLLCVLTEHSMTSNAVLDELDVAHQLSMPIVQVFPPGETADDLRVYSYLEELWVPKYGRALHTTDEVGEQAFLSALSSALGVDEPVIEEPGSLQRLAQRSRTDPPRPSLRLRNVDHVLAGRGSREETIEWMRHLELEHDNAVRARGASTVDLDEPAPLASRVARLLLAMPDDRVDVTVLQLRPLINRDVVACVQSVVVDTQSWKQGARAQKLLGKLMLELAVR